MKRVVILLCAAILFVGCNPCKRLTRLCPPTIQYDSIYIETVKLDTLVLVSPADTTYIQIPIISLEDLGIIINNADQEIVINVNEGIFTAKVICKEDSLLAIIAEKEIQIAEQKTVVKEVEVEVEVKHIPKIVVVGALFGLCCLIVIVMYVYFTIRTKGLKSLLKRI